MLYHFPNQFSSNDSNNVSDWRQSQMLKDNNCSFSPEISLVWINIFVFFRNAIPARNISLCSNDFLNGSKLIEDIVKYSIYKYQLLILTVIQISLSLLFNFLKNHNFLSVLLINEIFSSISLIIQISFIFMFSYNFNKYFNFKSSKHHTIFSQKWFTVAQIIAIYNSFSIKDLN